MVYLDQYESIMCVWFAPRRPRCQVLDAAGHPGRHAAAVVQRAGRQRGARQEVRHGAEHQDGEMSSLVAARRLT